MATVEPEATTQVQIGMPQLFAKIGELSVLKDMLNARISELARENKALKAQVEVLTKKPATK